MNRMQEIDVRQVEWKFFFLVLQTILLLSLPYDWTSCGSENRYFSCLWPSDDGKDHVVFWLDLRAESNSLYLEWNVKHLSTEGKIYILVKL